MLISIRKYLYENLKNQKGFTLVELLVVIAILGVLAFKVLGSTGDSTEDARITSTDADMNLLITKIQEYQAYTGYKFGSTNFPATNAGLNAALFAQFNVVNGTTTRTYGPLVTKDGWSAFGTDVNDRWGRPIRYTTSAPYQFISDGPDKTSNTTDDRAKKIP